MPIGGSSEKIDFKALYENYVDVGTATVYIIVKVMIRKGTLVGWRIALKNQFGYNNIKNDRGEQQI